MTESSQKSHQEWLRSKCFLQNIPTLGFSESMQGHQTLCDRFEEIVDRFPDNPALKSPLQSLTYSELNAQANGLAQHLLELGLKTRDRIGLLLSSGVMSGLAEVSCLKAGYTLVYLNVSFPPQRLQEMIEVCNIRTLITQSAQVSLAERLTGDGSTIINLENTPLVSEGKNPGLTHPPTTPTAIGFSSGSTGAPKLMIRDHVNDYHFIQRVSNSIGINPRDRILYTMGTLLMPFLALANGACYYPADLQQDGDVMALIDWIKDAKVTILRSPVSTFRTLCWALRESDEFPCLRLIVLQGEPVYQSDVAVYKKRFPDSCLLVSTLGISEFGDFCHFFVDKSTKIKTSTVPGGYTLKDVEVVLHKTEESKSDEVGEIAIRGNLISHETAERIGGDTYFTGDLGRSDPDGCIYHLGRKDFQVKIRGNRVDVLAVEATIMELPGISQAAVVGSTDTNGNVSLIAYVESQASEKDDIRRHLKASVPDFMIPSRILFLKQLPRTLTGKVDRKALPKETIDPPSKADKESEHSQGMNETCRRVAEIWKEVLKVDRITQHDAFIDLGGDSMKAMVVLARINQAFDIKLTMRTLFESGTLAKLSEVVARNATSNLK